MWGMDVSAMRRQWPPRGPSCLVRGQGLVEWKAAGQTEGDRALSAPEPRTRSCWAEHSSTHLGLTDLFVAAEWQHGIDRARPPMRTLILTEGA